MIKRAGRKTDQLHGFVMVEMLVVVGLVVIFVLTSAALLDRSLHLTRDASLAINRLLEVDGVADTLRRDVWAARDIAVPDPSSLTLAGPQGGETWKVTGSTITRRQDENAQIKSWPLAGLSFQAVPAGVMLWEKNPLSHTMHALRITSQVLLASGGVP